MSKRKRNARFFRLFVIIAAALLILCLSSTFIPYSDDDAQRIAIRAFQRGFVRESRPPEEIFRELTISPFRLSFHRSGGEMNGIWDTWRLSQSYELVLYGGIHRPGEFFRAEVQYRPDRMFFARLLMPSVGVLIGAGVILSAVRWFNRSQESRPVANPGPSMDAKADSN